MKYTPLVLLFALSMTVPSCIKLGNQDEEDVQFTKDDLSYLYYHPDSLKFERKPIKYKDTIVFLHNGSDTVRIPVETNIVPNYYPFSDDGLAPGIQGQSSIDFNNKKGIRYLEVTVKKTSNIISAIDYQSYMYFYINIYEHDTYSKKIYMGETIHTDTTSVLGVRYNDVLNLTPDSTEHTKIKSLYFAKRFGYIKIETTEGEKLERILPEIPEVFH